MEGTILAPGKRTVSSALSILGIGRLGSSIQPLVFGIDETVECKTPRTMYQ